MSLIGTFETCRPAPTMSVDRGSPEARVGRVLFNPPLHARWRVKENPPYGSCIEPSNR